MRSTAKIIGSSIGIAIMVALLTMAVLYGYSNRPDEAVCEGMEFVITDSDERLYVTPQELTSLLRAQDIYPVGRKMNRISLQRIEDAVSHHPMVRTAECYRTVLHQVKVRLTQRVPIVRIQTPIDRYLIDRDRKVMEDRPSVHDQILRVTGTIGVQMACSKMADFALWLADDTYWSDKIDHVYVQSPQMVYIYLKDSNTRIVMGPMQNYDRKLEKLRVFLLNRTPQIAAINYTELDLRYHGQVIGRY